MQFLSITDVPLKDKRVLIRADFNVPLKDGKITSSARIEAALKTIRYVLEHGAGVMLMSHLGRPVEGNYDENLSLKPVAERLSTLLDHPVRFEKNWLDGVKCHPGDVILCENVRFNLGEKKSDAALSRKMAALCDVFVMDAFATAHRAQASTYTVAKYAPVACAGLLLTDELNALTAALKSPKKPLVAIVGGAKISTKLAVLDNLLDKVDQLIVGGGIANTFLVAAGFDVGNSLVEADLVDHARRLLEKAKAKGVAIPLACDVRVAKHFSDKAAAVAKEIDDVEPDEMIFDIGPMTEKSLVQLIEKAKTILWNGPVGVFEFDAFAAGTKAIAIAIAKSRAFSVAGGGDTIAAIEKFDVKADISYLSTAGGAFLEFIEGKTLPGVEILCQTTDKGEAK